MREHHRNWAGNYTYRAARWRRPETVEHVQELVRRCRKLKPLGSRHCFNSIADTTMVAAGGEVVVLSREQHGDSFQGAVVGLGGLGMVTKLTLDVLPTFDIRQDVYEEWKASPRRSLLPAFCASIKK